MAVDALQLRPRSAVALLDAAVRVCATSTGVWALTLPGGAALVASLVHLAEAVAAHRSLVGPAALVTAAWALRAVGQGAACHHVEQLVLQPGPPRLLDSWRAALRRAPGLLTASAVKGLVDLVLWLFTLGLGFLFFGAHAAGTAATMRGEGSALGVYGTSSRLLGGARATAPWVRAFGLAQLLLAVNLQLGVALGLYLARAVLGFQVAFLERFTSVDNGTWAIALAAVTFALFEPFRATTGALLLIDGRVRQEGLELLAAAAQLPTRPRQRPTAGVALASALVLALGGAARAETPSGRLRALGAHCEVEGTALARLELVERLPEAEQASLSRFVVRLERLAWDEEDCEAVDADLHAGLGLLEELALAPPPPGDPAAAARATLARPEFATPPPAEPTDEVATGAPPGALQRWWDELWRAFWEWLRAQDRAAEPVDLQSPGSGAMALANGVMLVAVLGVVGVLAYLLLRGRGRPAPGDPTLDETQALSEQGLAGEQGALSRPAETWAGLADQLAARGEFREAMRHLYLALLARLHRDAFIDYDPTSSNWEYLLGFKGPAWMRGGFRELTARFDLAWYGNRDATGPAWVAFRATAEPLLAPPAPPVPGA